jgi:hypothetical protein
VASTNAFNVQSGFVSLVSAGYTKTFSVTGTCTGTFTLTAAPATTSTTFEGTAALSGNEAVTATLNGCTPSSLASTGTRFFNMSYAPLGSSFQGGNYGVYASVPVLPSAVHVGDVGTFGTVAFYTDSTKATSAGRQDVTYVVEADTATTAILNVISKNYNTSSVLTSTEQDRYKVAANGSLTVYSFDLQYTNGSTTHLIGN